MPKSDSLVLPEPQEPVSPALLPEPQGKKKKSEAPVDGLKLMRKSFEPHQISKMCKPTKKDNPPGRCTACGGWHKLPAVQLSYVGHAALTDRLLDADPMWTWEPLAYAPDGTPFLDSNGGMWIKLTVAGVTRIGYGDAQGKIGGDATKERIGDALRNAAMRFGAALELWHKGDLHIVEEPKEEADKETNEDFDQRTADQQNINVTQIQEIDKALKASGRTEEEIVAALGFIGEKRIEHIKKANYDKFLKWAKGRPTLPAGLKPASQIESPAQKAMKRLFATANEYRIPEGDVKTCAYEKFAVKSMTELSVMQIDEMVKWVKDVAEAVKES